MATIKPFNAVRPAAGKESSIAALPYDVYSRSEATEYVKDKPESFLRIDRAETFFSESVDTYDEKVYQKAKETYSSMKESGLFVKDSTPCLYLYEQTMNGRSQTGLVCTASVEEYFNGIIKKHENTRADKEKDRINHVDTLSAQTGPIFLAYRNNESLNSLFSKIKSNLPYFSITNNDVLQRCWVIDSKEDIDFIVSVFDKIPNLYIADGHHRCASAAKVSKSRMDSSEEAGYFLSVIFPDSELMIMDYNRVVKDLNSHSETELLDLISENFVVEEKAPSEDKPSKKGEIYMFLENKEYKLIVKDSIKTSHPVEGLDVSLLQKYLLDPILGIKDPKTDKRIDFVGGIRGVGELKRRIKTDSKIAFAMYPTSINELFNVADAGLLMPPKSTWFEPKLLSGLFIHEI